MRRFSKFFLAMVAIGQGVCAAPTLDGQLIGRWCSKQVTMHLANGTATSTKSNASQYVVQTFTKDRVVVEWARPPQSARWTESYAIPAVGQLSMKMLEHSSLPSLVGSKSAYHYEIQGPVLKLVTQSQAKEEPIVESTWARCEE